MSAATSEGTGRVYGVRRVCSAWELARSTWYAQAAATRPDRAPPAKRGPKTALSDEALSLASACPTCPGAQVRMWMLLVWRTPPTSDLFVVPVRSRLSVVSLLPKAARNA